MQQLFSPKLRLLFNPTISDFRSDLTETVFLSRSFDGKRKEQAKKETCNELADQMTQDYRI